MYDPYFSELKKGDLSFEDRITQDDFPVKVGDWIVFQLYGGIEGGLRVPRNKWFIRAVKYVRNTKDVPFWKGEHENFPGITIMELTYPMCISCLHTVETYFDGDEMYLVCNMMFGCNCDCNRENDLDYANVEVN